MRLFAFRQSSPGLIILGFTLLFILPALACNLPSRREPELIFPTREVEPTNQELQDATPSTFPSTPTPILTTSPASTQPTSTIPGIQSSTPGSGEPPPWQTPEPGSNLESFIYLTQPGDTLSALAARFGVSPDLISPPQPASGLLTIGQTLSIPNVVGETAYAVAAWPDSAIIYSPAAAGFSIEDYVNQAGGYLSTYQEEVDKEKHEWLSGAQIVRRVAENTSVNPRFLLAFLEFRSGWVRGDLKDPAQQNYPIGFYIPEYKGLYLELSVVAKELNIAYYGWREGSNTDMTLPDGSHVRVAPTLNAGTVAVQYLTTRFYLHREDWVKSLIGPKGFLSTYAAMFGDPWMDAARVEPLYTAGLTQPTLELPFAPGESWGLTAGPHVSWNTGTPPGALDFSPIIILPPCAPSPAWVTASAAGTVVRTGDGLIALDLDGDGLEQTGWVLIYMHVAEKDKAALGTRLNVDDRLGHPSCEGGRATGTNVHIARKYNGEWIAADGPVPLVLSGWTAHIGKQAYEGTLEKDGRVVSARPDGSSGSMITR